MLFIEFAIYIILFYVQQQNLSTINTICFWWTSI